MSAQPENRRLHSMTDRSAARPEDLFLLFALQLCIIGSNEGTNLVGHVEQPEPRPPACA
jgi:hypothetical protein